MSDNALSISQALSMIAEAINTPEDEVQPAASLDDLEGWDSMGVLLLMAELDERFSLLLEEETIGSFSTVADILKLLKDAGVLLDEVG
ncbi:acyl carrier protein [bacterium]|nr:acyl carrier protein [bacterium]MDG1663435.1 acyl carrier protein [Pseudomonadales bacterium]